MATYKGKDIGYVLLPMRITESNGKPALEIKKIVTICDKNQEFTEAVINASLKGETIIIPAHISFTDPLKTKLLLEEMGLIKKSTPSVSPKKP